MKIPPKDGIFIEKYDWSLFASVAALLLLAAFFRTAGFCRISRAALFFLLLFLLVLVTFYVNLFNS